MNELAGHHRSVGCGEKVAYQIDGWRKSYLIRE
jgi:hypothetical protein